VYDSLSNEFVGEVEIPVELQLMSQELHGHMTNFVKNKIESWFDSVRNMAKDEGIFDIKTEIFFDAKSIIESIIEYATQKNIDLIVIGTRGRTGLKRFFMGSVANGVVQHAHCSVLLVRSSISVSSILNQNPFLLIGNMHWCTN